MTPSIGLFLLFSMGAVVSHVLCIRKTWQMVHLLVESNALFADKALTEEVLVTQEEVNDVVAELVGENPVFRELVGEVKTLDKLKLAFVIGGVINGIMGMLSY